MNRADIEELGFKADPSGGFVYGNPGEPGRYRLWLSSGGVELFYNPWKEELPPPGIRSEVERSMVFCFKGKIEKIALGRIVKFDED